MAKDSFMKVYSNLPEDVRKEVVIVVKNKPYSWNAAYVEIENNTELGKEILKKLEALELI